MNTDNTYQQLIELEELAQVGYWEWNVLTKKFTNSTGFFKQVLQITYNFNIPSVIKRLRVNRQNNEAYELLTYCQNIKKGILPPSINIPIKEKGKIIKCFSTAVKENRDINHHYFSGIIQDITEKYRYNLLKEKEISFEKKIAQIASRFTQSGNFNQKLHYTLSELGQQIKSDQIKILKIENNKSNELYSWSSNKNIPEINFLKIIPPNEIKYFIEVLKEKKLINYNGPDDIPDCTIVTKSIFRQKPFFSIIISSLQTDNQTVGALLFAKYHNHDRWDFADIHMVKMSSVIVGNAIKQNSIQENLLNNEKRLQFALLAGSLGIWEYNLQQNTFFFDERFANIFGYSNIYLNNQNNWLQANIHPSDQLIYNEMLAECIKGNRKFFSNKYRIKCKDNSYKWVSDWGIVVEFDKNSHALKMVGVTQDISKTKQLEEDLILAKIKAENSEKLKSAFLANVSHEIRTPMNGISGFAELLYHNSVTETEKHHYLELIWKNSNRLLSLINNIIDISRIEAQQIELFERENNINELFDELENYYKKKINQNNNTQIYFKRFFTDQSSFIKVDANRLNQVLKNLIENAIKFTPKGYIEISYYLNRNGELEFCVKDTGQGIDETQFDIIFKHFTQSDRAFALNKGGSGLGLPIAKGLIDLMGGTIWFVSTKSIGSSFFFNIPYQPTRLTINNLQ